MKPIKYYCWGLFFLIQCFSCKKDNLKVYGVASINIIHASVGLSSVAVGFTSSPLSYSLINNAQNSFGNQQSIISFGQSSEFGNSAGSTPIQIISEQDTLHPLYNTIQNFPAGSIHSLYLIGEEPNVSTLLLDDHIPTFKDSTSAVRFINLSPDSKSVTINLQGNPPSQTEFSSLAYKQITTFKAYPATNQYYTNGYTFEVRDSSTGNLLTTFTWSIKPYYCNTLIIDGLENDNTGNYPVNVFQINNY